MASVGYEYSLDHQLRRKIQVQHVENEVTKEQTILPKFEDLPLGKDDPPYSAWGLWGDNDEVGTVVGKSSLLEVISLDISLTGAY